MAKKATGTAKKVRKLSQPKPARPVKEGSLYRGAYKTKEDCEADKPADHGSVGYECVQRTNEPLDN